MGSKAVTSEARTCIQPLWGHSFTLDLCHLLVLVEIVPENERVSPRPSHDRVTEISIQVDDQVVAWQKETQ